MFNFKRPNYFLKLTMIFFLSLLNVNFLIAATHSKKIWGYEGSISPMHWGKLNTAYRLCGEGQQQSPIDITNPISSSENKLQFDYQLANFFEQEDHQMIRLDPIQKGKKESVIFNGESYQLVEQHFHKPSEHLINGQRFPMELHLVHKNAAGHVLAIGVFIKSGNVVHAGFETILKQLVARQENDELSSSELEINPMDFIPKNLSYYQYQGSLTTPPCQEKLEWIVMTTPLEVSAQQLKEYDEIVPGMNARPVQKINQRIIKEVKKQ